MSNYYIDSHKLHLHPQRVAKWLKGEDIYPIYVEMAPAGTCNQRCIFCTMDFLGYKAIFLPTEVIKERVREMGTLGVKAIMYAGEGEPFLHKDMAEIAQATKAAGIDVSFSTNATLFKPELARQILPVTSWIKVSCNAGSPETYAAIHRAPAEHFNMVMRNMAEAVKIRAKEGYDCALGIQCLLLPETEKEMVPLARRAREIGFDYLVIKPYSRHRKSLNNRYGDISYKNCGALAAALQAESRPNFQVIFRNDAMQRWDSKKMTYNCCLALPYWCYVDAECNVWGCSRFLGDERMRYGNLVESKFAEIWHGPKRAESLTWSNKHLNLNDCHTTCRMEAINNYLWRMRNPQEHDNFI